jgi:hypothetical protein
MNFKELGINSVRPVAKLEGGLNGVRLIVEARKEKGYTEILSVLPPDYDLSKAIPIEQYILESAVAKHGYIPVSEQPIMDFKQYEEYLRRINQPEPKK